MKGCTMSSGKKSSGEEVLRTILAELDGACIRKHIDEPIDTALERFTESLEACCRGKSVPERAKALISIAHPDFREDLEREAAKIYKK